MEPYDVHAKLEDPMGVLAIALGQWQDRDDTKAQPEVRRAANTAMDAIDAMLAGLYQMRSRLVGEIRVSDDANGARVDAMLAARVADLEANTVILQAVFDAGRASVTDSTPGPRAANSHLNVVR
jgi:hypothetical protein